MRIKLPDAVSRGITPVLDRLFVVGRSIVDCTRGLIYELTPEAALVATLAVAPGCMGMDPGDVTGGEASGYASQASVGGTFESTSKTSGHTGTDSASSTSGASATGADTSTGGESDSSSATSDTTGSTSMSVETSGTTTTGEVTTGATDTGTPCLEGTECNNGKCMNIDGVDQCVCNDLCFKGGNMDCYSECAEGCYDKNNDPANPNCVQIDPDILPPPTFWGSKGFIVKKSEAPFFKEGMTHKETKYLMLDIDGGFSQPISTPTFDPNMPNWNGYWGGNDELFVLPTYDGLSYQFCLRAVKKVVPSAPVCFEVAGTPN